MQLAKIENDNIKISEHTTLFPNVSFPESGPNEEFISENECFFVKNIKEHDPKTQKLVESQPYIENNLVYTVIVVDKTQDEISIENTEKLYALQNEIVMGTQNRLDDFAKMRGYDGIMSACTYANSKIPRFSSDGKYCSDLRDATWAKLYEILGEVQSGVRPVPKSYAEVEQELPVLEWPKA